MDAQRAPFFLRDRTDLDTALSPATHVVRPDGPKSMTIVKVN